MQLLRPPETIHQAQETDILIFYENGNIGIMEFEDSTSRVIGWLHMHELWGYLHCQIVHGKEGPYLR